MFRNAVTGFTASLLITVTAIAANDAPPGTDRGDSIKILVLAYSSNGDVIGALPDDLVAALRGLLWIRGYAPQVREVPNALAPHLKEWPQLDPIRKLSVALLPPGQTTLEPGLILFVNYTEQVDVAHVGTLQGPLATYTSAVRARYVLADLGAAKTLKRDDIQEQRDFWQVVDQQSHPWRGWFVYRSKDKPEEVRVTLGRALAKLMRSFPDSAGLPKKLGGGRRLAGPAESPAAVEAGQGALARDEIANDVFEGGKLLALANNMDSSVGWESAMECFRTVVELKPDSAGGWALLAEAYGGMATRKKGAERQSYITKTLDTLKIVRERRPAGEGAETVAGVLNNVGILLGREGGLEEAAGMFRAAAEADPSRAGTYYYNLGRILLDAGKLDLAAEACRSALDADASYGPAILCYGTALLGTERYSEARGILEQYLKSDPAGEYARSARGLLDSVIEIEGRKTRTRR